MDSLQRKQLTEALIQAALLQGKEVYVHVAEIVAHLQRGEHLAALGTFKHVEEMFQMLGTTLSACARLSQ